MPEPLNRQFVHAKSSLRRTDSGFLVPCHGPTLIKEDPYSYGLLCSDCDGVLVRVRHE